MSLGRAGGQRRGTGQEVASGATHFQRQSRRRLPRDVGRPAPVGAEEQHVRAGRPCRKEWPTLRMRGDTPDLLDFGTVVHRWTRAQAQSRRCRSHLPVGTPQSEVSGWVPVQLGQGPMLGDANRSYHAVRPPSTIRFDPVINDEASETRKMMAPLYSSLWAIRPSGTTLEKRCTKAGSWSS